MYPIKPTIYSTILFLRHLSAKNCISFNVYMIISNMRKKSRVGWESCKQVRKVSEDPSLSSHASAAASALSTIT